MYFPISDLKLTQIDSGAVGAIFVGTEMYGSHRPSSYVVVDGGKMVSGKKLALGLSGKGAFSASQLGQDKLFGLALPPVDLVMFELGEPKTGTFSGSLDVGQLLVTPMGAYLGIEYEGGKGDFALANLQTWTLEDYADLMKTDVKKALLLNWRLVHRAQDRTMVLAESSGGPPLTRPETALL